jgi:hypothetical protein
MDFIVGLLLLVCRKKAYNVILVVMDRFSKIVQYIACTGEINAPKLIERLFKVVF